MILCKSLLDNDFKIMILCVSYIIIFLEDFILKLNKSLKRNRKIFIAVDLVLTFLVAASAGYLSGKFNFSSSQNIIAIIVVVIIILMISHITRLNMNDNDKKK